MNPISTIENFDDADGFFGQGGLCFRKGFNREGHRGKMSLTPDWQWFRLQFTDSPLESVIPKAGLFQPAEGSCVGYLGSTAREIPHYA
jgi:hypothetical protein